MPSAVVILSAARGESSSSNGMTGAKSKDPDTECTVMLHQGVRTKQPGENTLRL